LISLLIIMLILPKKKLKVIFSILFTCASFLCSSQSFYLKIETAKKENTNIIDSVGYANKHKNAASISLEIEKTIIKLNNIGFFEAEMLLNNKSNDSTFISILQLNQKTTLIVIPNNEFNFIEKHKNLPQNNSTGFKPNQLSYILNSIIEYYEQKGFPLINIKLGNFYKKNKILYANIITETKESRLLNDIIVNGYKNYPKQFLKPLLKKTINKPFTKKTLNKVYTEFEKIPFIKQNKFPEILFTKDSTKIYTYIEKINISKFDGYLGFITSEKNKITLNGYVDFNFLNILNSGENIIFNWRNNGDNQTNFNTSINLPYIFNSNLAITAELNIFKKDSTFQNTNTSLELGYLFNLNKKLYIGIQKTESSDIQNINSTTLNDFNKNLYTIKYTYSNKVQNNFLINETSRFELKLASGKRESKLFTNNQTQIELEAFYNFKIKNNLNLFVKINSKNMLSDTYLNNEMYFFGGLNTIRGFNENRFNGNQYVSLISELQLFTSNNLYINSILDYAAYKNKVFNVSENIFGYGIGLGLKTSNGLFKISVANGNSTLNKFEAKNSIIHLSFTTLF